nr:helix-turn-helix transcriptional regulator [uncultured Blautia sp.]
MTSYEEFRKGLLNDPDVAAEYEALEPEFDIIRSLMEARISQNMTQKELSERTGITQADISRIENGTRNPSLSMLKRLAKGLGCRLKVEFIPNQAK